MNLGTRIKQRMGELGWTPMDLSRESKVPYPTLMGILKGHQVTSTKTPQLANAMGVNALWLSEGKGPKLIQADELNAQQPPQDMRLSSQNLSQDDRILLEAEIWLSFEESEAEPLQGMRRLERLMELAKLIKADGGSLSTEHRLEIIEAKRQQALGATHGRTTKRGNHGKH